MGLLACLVYTSVIIHYFYHHIPSFALHSLNDVKPLLSSLPSIYTKHGMASFLSVFLFSVLTEPEATANDQHEVVLHKVTSIK